MLGRDKHDSSLAVAHSGMVYAELISLQTSPNCDVTVALFPYPRTPGI
jgi:hypothetical protein